MKNAKQKALEKKKNSRNGGLCYEEHPEIGMHLVPHKHDKDNPYPSNKKIVNKIRKNFGMSEI